MLGDFGTREQSHDTPRLLYRATMILRQLPEAAQMRRDVPWYASRYVRWRTPDKTTIAKDEKWRNLQLLVIRRSAARAPSVVLHESSVRYRGCLLIPDAILFDCKDEERRYVQRGWLHMCTTVSQRRASPEDLVYGGAAISASLGGRHTDAIQSRSM